MTSWLVACFGVPIDIEHWMRQQSLAIVVGMNFQESSSI